MRAIVFSVALTGCGPVILGEQATEAGAQPDAMARGASDAALAAPRTGADAGESEHGADAAASNVVSSDAATMAVVKPLLCLQNPSFEGTPGFNPGVPEMFDAAPWTACTNPAMPNTPEISDGSTTPSVAAAPKPTDGATFLGLAAGDQVSQEICRPAPGGSSLSFQIDLARIHLSPPMPGGVSPDSGAAFLEVWGGVAADCSQRELLWASPNLTSGWQTFCVTIEPQSFVDSLTLRSRSDGSLPTATYLAVDHIVPVERCL